MVCFRRSSRITSDRVEDTSGGGADVARHDEPLDEHLRRSDPQPREAGLHDVHVGTGPTEVEVGVGAIARQRRALRGIEEAALRVEVVMDREAFAGFRAQPLERAGEDDRIGVAVRVDERDRSGGGRERALDDREDGRDAAAPCEGDDRGVGLAQHEEPRRAHHLEGVARRERASFIQLDIRPPGTRFTVVVKGSPVSGELDIE